MHEAHLVFHHLIQPRVRRVRTNGGSTLLGRQCQHVHLTGTLAQQIEVSAPFAANSLTEPGCPKIDARDNGGRPPLSAKSGLAPPWSKIPIARSCPFEAANHKAVRPSLSCVSRFDLCWIRISMISCCPLRAASINTRVRSFRSIPASAPHPQPGNLS